MKRFEIGARLVLVLVDGLWIWGAFVLAYWVRFGTLARTDFVFGEYAEVAMVATVVWLGVMLGFRVYAFGRGFTSLFHLKRMVSAHTVGVAFFILLFFFWKHQFYSRLIIVYVWGFSVVGVALIHLFFRWVRARLVLRGVGVMRTLVVGSNRMAEVMIKKLNRLNSSIRPVAVLDAYGATVKQIDGVRVMGKLDKLEEVVREERIDLIMQADNIEHTLNLIAYAEKHGLEYRLLPSLLGMYHAAEEVYVEDEPMIRTARRKEWYEVVFGK